MNNGRPKTRRAPAIVLLAILAAVLFLALAPNVEETRREARIGRAYRAVCEIAASDGNDDTPILIESYDADPWGQPFRITKTGDGLIVASNGPNQTTPDFGYDRDDIYSNMASSPVEMIHRNKRWQLLAALSAPIIWLIGTLAYLAIPVDRVA